MNFSKYYIGIILLCAIAGITAKFLVLTPETVALMYLDSKMYDDAMKKYEQMLAEGNEAGNVIIPLAKIYAQQGEIKKAIGLLIRYTHKKPDLLNAEKVMPQIYKNSINHNEYVRILQKVPDFSYPNEVLTDFSSWYESTLQDDKQIAILTELAKKPDDTQIDNDYRKLVFYYTTDTKFQTFSSLVKQLVSNAYPGNRKEPFLTLLIMMVSSEHYEKAMSFACKYLEEKRPRDPFEIEKAANIFMNAGQNRMASEICTRFLNKADSRTTVQIYNFRKEMAKGDESKVLDQIKNDFDSSSIKSKLIYDIGIKLAMKYGDSKLVKDILLRPGTASLGEDEMFDYAFYALKNSDKELAEILKTKIGPETLRLVPCLNYIIKSAFKGIPVKTMVSLACKSSELDDDDLVQLGYIMYHNDFLKESLLLIKDRPTSKVFPIFKIRDLVKVIVSCGNPKEFTDRYEKELLLLKNRGGLLRDTLFVMASASGQVKLLEKLIAEDKDIPLPVLIDAYSLAEASGQYNAAVALAETVCRGNQGDVYQYFLATALVDSGNFNKALTLLLKLKKNMRPAEGLFLKAVARDIELCGLNRIPNEARYEIEPTLNGILGRKDVTVTELKRAAVCLAALGEREKAQRIYLKVCMNDDVRISDIDEFAAMCKRFPMENVKKWFLKQAETGKWEKWRRVTWLNQLGMEKDTVRIVDRVYRKVELDYLAEYLTALRAIGREKEAKEVLNRYDIAQLLKASLRERIGLISFLSKTDRVEWVRQLLNSFTAGELVENLSPVDIASLFISTKMEKEGLKLFAGSGNPTGGELNVILFLSAYSGDEKFVENWLDLGLQNPEDVLMNLYYFSLRNKRTGLALAIARKLFNLYNTDGNRFRLAEALIAEKKYKEGIALVYDDAGKNFQAGEIYISGITGLASTGKFSKESPEAARFIQACENILKSKDIRKPLLVTIAYALSNTGYHEKAKNIFYELACSDPDIKDSFTKMYLYSTVMSPERKDFKLITKLIDKTKKEDEGKVLSLLETYGMQGQVMLLVEKRYGSDIPLDIYPKYLNSLLKCRQMKTFDLVVKKLPPPLSFSIEQRCGIFECLVLAGKEKEASVFYDALDQKKQNMTPSLVRRLGFYFANNKNYGKAIPVFFELAKAGNDPDSSDLSLLVSLPGIGENKEVVDWLVKQAKTSKDEKQLKWLDYLNYVKQPGKVIEILKEYYAE
jgi:tetratricopeptide (TPR) repeat protein